MDAEVVATELNLLIAPYRNEAQRASAEGDIRHGEAGMAIAIALDTAAYKGVPVPLDLLESALRLADKGAVHEASLPRLRALAT